MTITLGKIHKYLRITINHSSPGKVIFYMIYYIGKMLDYTPEEMKGVSETPVAHHLFDIAEDATKLTRTNADLFHHFMAQLLYLSKISHPNIQLSVSLLARSRRRCTLKQYFGTLLFARASTYNTSKHVNLTPEVTSVNLRYTLCELYQTSALADTPIVSGNYYCS